MYISQVEIDINNRKKMRKLTHLGVYHDWVESSFPEELKNNIRTRKLWRIDKIRGKKYLLIVSEKAPNIQLLERYGIHGSAKTKDYGTFINSLKKGMKVRFRVTLNTVVSKRNKSDDYNSRGKVQPVKSSEQNKFLIDRSKRNGFSLKEDEFQIVERGYEKFKHRENKSIDLMSATYEGILTIIDEEKFRSTLILGIGKKKAYGFGMMTVIPVHG